MKCDQCGATVPDGWPHCIDCGSPRPRVAAIAVDQHVEADVFPLLAAANISRKRGNFDDARKRCEEILRAHPQSTAALSLMGQVSEDQGRYADAASWYQQAIALDPASETDRALLTRALQRQATARRRGSRALLLVVPRWWRSIRSKGAGGLGPQGIAIAVLFLICVGLVFYLGHLLSSPSSSTDNFLSHLAMKGETAQEQALRATLNGGSFPGVSAYTIDNVQVDPAPRPFVRVTATMSDAAYAANSRTIVIQVAAAAARAAADAHIPMFTIRVVGPVGTTGRSGTTGAALLFIADARPSALSMIEPASVTPDAAPRYFQNIVWSRYLY